MADPIKQVLVFRRKYPDGKGGTRKVNTKKLMSQIAHATWLPFLDRKVPRHDLEKMGFTPNFLIIPLTDEMATWVYDIPFTKIVLTVETEADLLRALKMAQDAGLPTSLCTDAGLTEFREECSSCGGTGHTSTFPPRPQGYDQPTCSTCEGTGKVSVPTNTAIAIGPAIASEIDKITGRDGAVKTKLP